MPIRRPLRVAVMTRNSQRRQSTSVLPIQPQVGPKAIRLPIGSRRLNHDRPSVRRNANVRNVDRVKELIQRDEGLTACRSLAERQAKREGQARTTV